MAILNGWDEDSFYEGLDSCFVNLYSPWINGYTAPPVYWHGYLYSTNRAAVVKGNGSRIVVIYAPTDWGSGVGPQVYPKLAKVGEYLYHCYRLDGDPHSGIRIKKISLVDESVTEIYSFLTYDVAPTSVCWDSNGNIYYRFYRYVNDNYDLHILKVDTSDDSTTMLVDGITNWSLVGAKIATDGTDVYFVYQPTEGGNEKVGKVPVGGGAVSDVYTHSSYFGLISTSVLKLDNNTLGDTSGNTWIMPTNTLGAGSQDVRRVPLYSFILSNSGGVVRALGIYYYTDTSTESSGLVIAYKLDPAESTLSVLKVLNPSQGSSGVDPSGMGSVGMTTLPCGSSRLYLVTQIVGDKFVGIKLPYKEIL